MSFQPSLSLTFPTLSFLRLKQQLSSKPLVSFNFFQGASHSFKASLFLWSFNGLGLLFFLLLISSFLNTLLCLVGCAVEVKWALNSTEDLMGRGTPSLPWVLSLPPNFVLSRIWSFWPFGFSFFSSFYSKDEIFGFLIIPYGCLGLWFQRLFNVGFWGNELNNVGFALFLTGGWLWFTGSVSVLILACDCWAGFRSTMSSFQRAFLLLEVNLGHL